MEDSLAAKSKFPTKMFFKIVSFCLSNRAGLQGRWSSAMLGHDSKGISILPCQQPLNFRHHRLGLRKNRGFGLGVIPDPGIERGHTPPWRVQTGEHLVGDARLDLRAEPEGERVFVGDQHAAGLLDADAYRV